jgi:hypothetical protein
MSNKQLSNDDVDLKLKHRNIVRLSDYTTAQKKINFQCLICNYVWETIPRNICNRGRGCPNCSKKARINNDIVDQRLSNRHIKRIGDYKGIKTRLNFQCLQCNHIWLGYPTNVLHHGYGCPKCAGVAKLNNESIDANLTDRNITRIQDYINSKNMIQFQCDDCHFIWKAIPRNIYGNKLAGCPICSGIKINENLIFLTLRKHDIQFDPQFKLMHGGKFLKADFYIKQFNLIIEYNGAQHYRPVRFGGISQHQAEINFINQIKRDDLLKALCVVNGFRLLEIDGRNFTYQKLINLIEILIESEFKDPNQNSFYLVNKIKGLPISLAVRKIEERGIKFIINCTDDSFYFPNEGLIKITEKNGRVHSAEWR